MRRLFLVIVVGWQLLLLPCTISANDGLSGEPIRPVPRRHDENSRKVALGERLFHDPRLSGDDTVACSSCHQLAIGGVDRLPRSFGVGGAVGVINTPTVYNSGFNVAQFWDGRARDLEQQVEGPVHNPVEMLSDWPQVIAKLNKDEQYPAVFQAVYGDRIKREYIRDAIAAFERTLITPNSPFDRWLLGDFKALSEQQKRGYSLFKSYGCVACHQGVNVGGNMYQHMGAMGDYFSDRDEAVSDADLGRYNVTGDASDRHYFKVPSLRLAALTPPYFHDASVDTLQEAIRVMGLYQLGRNIPDADVQAIEAFIKSLVGTHPRLNP